MKVWISTREREMYLQVLDPDLLVSFTSSSSTPPDPPVHFVRYTISSLPFASCSSAPYASCVSSSYTPAPRCRVAWGSCMPRALMWPGRGLTMAWIRRGGAGRGLTTAWMPTHGSLGEAAYGAHASRWYSPLPPRSAVVAHGADRRLP